MSEAGAPRPLPRWVYAGLIALAVLGIVVAAAFAYRLYQRRHRPPPPPRQTDVSLIAGWMTVPYVGRAFRVPPDEIFKALDVPPRGNERKSLNDLAAAQGRSPGELVAAVQAIVQDWQASHPPPKPGGRPGAESRGPPAAATAAGRP
jgi:heme/copper-type cytochrome/quinol oxidase subunit 2